MKNIYKLLVSLLAPHIAGFMGSAFTMKEIPTWYMALEKPWFTPPNWVFFPVWTTLYTLMGLASYLVWREHPRSPHALWALKVFWAHLIVNALWSVVFFGMHAVGLALIIVVGMWLVIAYLIYLFAKVRPVAGILLVPYLMWITVATSLNAGVWLLN